MCEGTNVCPIVICAAEAVASRDAGVATDEASLTLRVSNVILDAQAAYVRPCMACTPQCSLKIDPEHVGSPSLRVGMAS